MFCDTHCHLFKEYYQDIDAILELSNKNQVNRFIVSGCDSSSNQEVMDLIQKENVYGTLGIHPEDVHNYSDEDLEFIEQHLKEKKIIAIGEIGLDYHYTKENKEAQKYLFERQLSLAEKYQLPVVIHSRDATEDTIQCLKKYKVQGVIHSFSGSLETANIYIKMGFLLGINGVITFKNCNLKEVFEHISTDFILLETDSPYLTPVPYRGSQNNPSHILDIAKFICELYSISLEELAKITNSNIRRIFDI